MALRQGKLANKLHTRGSSNLIYSVPSTGMLTHALSG